MPNATTPAEEAAAGNYTPKEEIIKNNLNSVVPIIKLKDQNLELLVGNNIKSSSGSGENNPNNKDKKIPFGGFSFESESLPDFSEFEENTNSGESQEDGQSAKNTATSGTRPSDGQMAPTTTIETVTISRPLKVIAFICGLFACLLLIMALAASEWLVEPEGYRQGLFVYCISHLDPGQLVPFVDNDDPDLIERGCHRIDLSKQAYTLIAAGFVVVSLLVNVFATLLTVLGLRCRDPNNKYKYYRIAVWVMAVALIAILVSLVVYPVCFANLMEEAYRQTGRRVWEFGWAYGVGWGAAIFLFGGVILLLCDKESEEIYYKERTIVQYADTNNKA